MIGRALLAVVAALVIGLGGVTPASAETPAPTEAPAPTPLGTGPVTAEEMHALLTDATTAIGDKVDGAAGALAWVITVVGGVLVFTAGAQLVGMYRP